MERGKYFHYEKNPADPALGKRFVVYFHHKRWNHARFEGEPVIITKPFVTVIPLLLLVFIFAGMVIIYLKFGIIRFDSEFTLGGVRALLFLIPVVVLLFYLAAYTSRIYIYRNCLVLGNCYKKRTFYFNDLDAIESGILFQQYRRPTARGTTGFTIYNLIKDGQVIYTLHAINFKNIEDLETAFSVDNHYVKNVIGFSFEEPGTVA